MSQMWDWVVHGLTDVSRKHHGDGSFSRQSLGVLLQERQPYTCRVLKRGAEHHTKCASTGLRTQENMTRS